MIKCLLYFSIIFITSCASKPVLYPNKKFEAVGKEVADKDIVACEENADKFLNSAKGKKILKSAGKGGILGGAIGAVTGLLRGDVVGGVASGAAIGATAGGVGQAISPNELKQRFITRCLTRKGYEVIGFD